MRDMVQDARLEGLDPALTELLDSIERDIAAGRKIRRLDPSMMAVLREAARIPVDLDERIEGEVAL
jgi:hypothetical protein